jgi:5-methylcytosine-specific restriction endonuclease McrA
MEQCVILNGDFSFLSIVDWKKALNLWIKGKTEILKYSDKEIRNGEGVIITKLPIVMKLIKIVRMIYRNKVPFSKRNILIRDGHKCVYCGCTSDLTVDHVIPSASGGKTNFENCVCACLPCNNKKRNRTPSEARMFLKKQPYAPTISEFMQIKIKRFKFDEILKDIFQGV